MLQTKIYHKICIKRNYDVLSWRPTGFMLCFSHVNAIFQSIFHSFIQNLLHAKVGNLVFIICSLLVRMNYVTDKLKGE